MNGVVVPKRHVFRRDDRVRILRPRIVRRVGYPLHYRDLKPEAIHLLQAIDLKTLGLSRPLVYHELVEGLAKALVRDRAFGGNIRSIHYYEVVPQPEPGTIHERLDPFNPENTQVYDCTGVITTVYGKRVVKTGERFAGGSYETGNGTEWEDGGLANCKTHILLWTGVGWIETCDVEPV